MKSVGPFKTAQEIEIYVLEKYHLPTHVYHVYSQRKLKIVYADRLSKIFGGLSIKTIKVNAIYYVQPESIDNIMTEILVPDVEITAI